MKGVFSPVGTYIPGKKMTLAKGVIRGVESNGMLCSAAELELSDDHDGIIELADDAPVGVAYARFAGLDDPVIDVAVTPNRPDATGVAGIARDLAAAGLGSLKTPAPKPLAGAFDCPTRVHLDFAPADQRLCPAFALRLVRGVTNGPSPEWMQKRLRAIGLRPISALVDITNYITFDRGRPLHVFDFAKVAGDLAVRRARPGESVLALDGKSYALDETMVVIADANGVESIAGIMGGEHSGCDETTRDVLIESALWDPTNIAQTGRKLGIMTDARYRFERGVDPEFCVPGCDLATEFVLSICGGEPSRIVVAGDPSPPRRSIPFPYGEVKRLLGVDDPAPGGRGDPRPAGLRRRGWNGRRPFVAARRPGQGRRRRADPAHRRRRPRAGRAPAPARRRRGEAGADAVAEAHPARQAHAGRARAARGGHLVVRLEGGGGTVRRRRAVARARQSDRGRPFRHAPEPHSGPRRRRRAQRAPGLERRCAVRSRAGFSRTGRKRPAHRRRVRAARQGQGGRGWPALERRRPRSTSSTPSAMR